MTATTPGRPDMAAAERAGLELARARAQKRIDGLHRSTAEVEDRLRGAADPTTDPVAIRELSRRHTELLGRLADAIAQRDALERYLDRLRPDHGQDGGPASP